MGADVLVRDWVEQLVEAIRRSTNKASGPLADFDQGYALGLGEALWLLQQHSIHLGLDTTELGLPTQDGITMAMEAILKE